MFAKIVLGVLVCFCTSMFGMSLKELNSASKEALMAIKGIGEVKADAIIAERGKEKFKSFEDLQRVKGIGPKTAENIQNDVKSKSAQEEE
ncbi:MAG: helix-hairpin-helix domain-containing protein [Sulfurovum sp.]|nr:helix-hairpin-helix domain-containing protein [Sulfurovum sp.]MDD3602255.1 helix-hairpin-helix domain-containing protein [Sulfurovum sp.]